MEIVYFLLFCYNFVQIKIGARFEEIGTTNLRVVQMCTY